MRQSSAALCSVFSAALTLGCVDGDVLAASEPMRIRSVSPERAAIRLLEPRPDRPLLAGSTVRLAWDWTEDRAREIEEWEAFLSLNGGASYPLRITPHLDGRLRDVAFDLPDCATTDARILIRFGDERDETAVEFKQAFTITDRAAASRYALTSESMPNLLAGEAAIGGADPVVIWVDGPRDGSQRWRVESASNERWGDRGPRLVSGSQNRAALRSSSPRLGDLTREESSAGVPFIRTRRAPLLATERVAPLSPLALTSRRNE